MTPPSEFDVAIIGMAGRFPGAKDIEAFWDNLRNGREGICFFSDEELEGHRDSRPNFVKAKGVIDDIDLFDADFFNISAREAEWMDPQQRLFLEGAWEALENAGYDPVAYRGQISVYAGVNTNTYLLSRLGNLQGGDPANDFRILLSNEKDHLATRVAYKLNLRGESITVQTSCSTSLVAVHLAYQSVLSGQSNMALAGGISIRVPQKTGYLYQEGMVGSPDGHCRPFDAKAKGTVPGHGFGIVVLKLLSEALRDRDTVYAVIKGSAINNDGSNKVGYTAPSVEGQANVVAKALAIAGVNADQITFVEGHGTGTPLGDPIEVEALTRAYRKYTQRRQYCVLGAVKSMIGHLDNAAGVAGLIKTVLALRHGEIPPTLHFETPNPMLNLESSPFRVNNTLLTWPLSEGGRYAGVSSFGIGGTNVHMVVAEAPDSNPAPSRDQTRIVTLSAKSPQSLKRMSEGMIAYLRQNRQADLADVAFTRNAGRQALEYRIFATGRTREEILDSLSKLSAKDAPTAASKGTGKLAFLFPGQGAQRVGATQQVYDEQPEFRRNIDQCFRLVRSKCGLDLHSCLYGPHSDAAEAARTLAQPGLSLPTLFSIEYSLAQLWMSWGINPSVLFGHSFGEYIAACLAGVFTLEEGLWLAAMRGKLMEKLPSGAMTAVRLPAQEVSQFLQNSVVVSANNSRTDCTISGPTAEIEETERRLRENSVAFRRMDVPYAYHSSMVEGILDEFRGLFKSVSLRRPSIPMISSLTGSWIDPDQVITADYWVKQMRQPVQFAPGVDLLYQSSVRTYLEVGPSAALAPLVVQHFGKREAMALSSFDGASTRKGEGTALLRTLGCLWSTGFNIDWMSFYRHEECRRIPLPSYPFERKRHWIEIKSAAVAPAAASPALSPKESTVARSAAETDNGQAQNGANGGRSHVSPRNELEQLLAEIWIEVLGHPNIAITDSFYELGGDSLTAVQVYSRLKQAIAVDLTLEQVLSAPTIVELSRTLQKQIKQAAGIRFEDRELDASQIIHLQIGDEQAAIYVSGQEINTNNIAEASDQLALV
jgi:acyl transferase domain-containing protein